MKIKKILPGLILSLIIAIIAKIIEISLPLPFISGSVIAIFIGIYVNRYIQKNNTYTVGINFTSKRLLKFAIILLGASLNVTTILNVGKLSITVMVFTLLTCFGLGYFIGKALGLNWKLSNLISAGTGICGGSAIAAIAPVIEAEDVDIAYAMSATFIFDMFMIILFPIMGKALSLSDVAYGLWTGTAVNDTSSVVAAGYAFSEAAGDFATMVKLTRTLVIIPTVIIFAIVNNRLKYKSNNSTSEVDVDYKNTFPWFIVGFLIMSMLYSLNIINEEISALLKSISKFLMIVALASIGLKTSMKDMKKAGTAPMLHGFIISVLVIIVAFCVEYAIGLI